ncbi:hypothetical protein [Bacillus testis]|uniref:hypothetical protein n=1 Tax=Bacillus testis TaxID=1622072 RepID=UPI000B1C7884|nr:hypothetical protein [Bacillus testis]
MMKKVLAAFLTLSLALSPLGSYVFQDQDHHASAKSYKSGKRGFNSNNGGISNFQNNKKTTNQQNSVTNKDKTKNNQTNTASTKRGGGFMKGMLFGGLAGMLFGGLFGNMGAFGALLGLVVNVLAIVVLISIVVKIISLFTNKRRREEDRTWRN